MLKIINYIDFACARYSCARKKKLDFMDKKITVCELFTFLAALYDKFAVRCAFLNFTTISLCRRCSDSVREFRCEIPSTLSDFLYFKQRISMEFSLFLGSVLQL